jgi:hypothetical protein
MNILRGRYQFSRREKHWPVNERCRRENATVPFARPIDRANFAPKGHGSPNPEQSPGKSDRTTNLSSGQRPKPAPREPLARWAGGTDGVLSRPQGVALGWKNRGPSAQFAGLLLVVSLLLTGCGQELDTLYGQRRGSGAETSVNGTSVFSGMCARAGHKVYGAMSLSPRLAERADCIVWFPNDFEPPTPDVRKWFQDWLIAQPGRTLIYVGRDYDAARWYWKKIQPSTPDELQAELQRRMSKAAADFSIDRQAVPNSKDCLWFTVESKYQQRDVRTLKGDPAWLRGIDPAGLEIELCGRMKPSEYAEVFLESEGDMLLSRESFDESQLLVVANGSFLLNLPLVNHEHRKLAGKLIDAIGPAGQTVVFLESFTGGPPIRPDDPIGGMPTGAEIFSIWPTNWILLHLVIVGILFCFWRFPILGVPRSPEPRGLADFGHHIAAIAELLERGGDRAYAEARLAQYRQQTKTKE